MKKNISKITTLLLLVVLVFSSCAQKESPEEAKSESTEKVTEKAMEKESEASSEEATTATGTIKKEVEPVNIKVMMPYGTPTLSMIKMVKEKPSLSDNVAVDYEPIQATDVLVASLVNAEPDIAIVPTNLAAVINSKGVDYKLAASSVWGVLYMVSTEDINSLEDLKGKKVGAFGRNLTPDIVLRYLLGKNGIDADTDMELEYFAGAPEAAANIIAGNLSTAIVPQPVLNKVLMKNKEARVVLDLQEEWRKITDSKGFPQASIIVKGEFYKEHKELANKFLAEYEEAIQWLNENPAEAGQYYEELGIGLNAKILENAIPNSNIQYVSALDAKDKIKNYLDILFEYNPKLLGGKAFDEGILLEK